MSCGSPIASLPTRIFRVAALSLSSLEFASMVCDLDSELVLVLTVHSFLLWILVDAGERLILCVAESTALSLILATEFIAAFAVLAYIFPDVDNGCVNDNPNAACDEITSYCDLTPPPEESIPEDSTGLWKMEEEFAIMHSVPCHLGSTGGKSTT